ncbi:MAG TPA: hypothetical protein VMI11_10525 [Actinomycetes bacterium]|nr:hypothetical protein [Actinomycetes bacterium]
MDEDLAAIALDVIARVQLSEGWPQGHQHAVLESIEAVELDDEPGICMTWRQGENAFGLLNSVRRLVELTGAAISLPFYLGLAIDEPHPGSLTGVRVWFIDLPSS